MKSFWKHSAEIAAAIRKGRLLVTLDFDGTLAALAPSPRLARMKPEVKSALRRLAALPGVSVFVLSGRALEDLAAAVGLRGLYYGGNHGMEIKGPGFAWRDRAAAGARRAVAAAAAAIARAFPRSSGLLVEDKGLTASVHYRALKPALRGRFFAFMRAAAPPAGLRWSRGHKVFELRPEAAPHKGDALLRLRRLTRSRAALALGDDLTDEDMFRALAGGLSVRVGRKAASAASYCLAGQRETLRLLRFVAAARLEEVK